MPACSMFPGEESLKQIKIHAARLHISSPELYILAETDMEQIINETELLEADILIVDSIQTVYKRDLTAAPGGTTQIKECAMSLMQYAKNRNVTILLLVMLTKRVRWQARKSLSTWWTACCISKGNPQVRSAVCVRRKTATAQPMKSACLK